MKLSPEMTLNFFLRTLSQDFSETITLKSIVYWFWLKKYLFTRNWEK